MIRKLLVSIAALLMLSGCCRFLGFCTSASVTTSITPSQQFAQQGCSQGTQASQLPTVADAGMTQGSQAN